MGATGALLVVHPWRHSVGAVGTVWTRGLHVHALVRGKVNARARPKDAFVRVLRHRQESLVGTISYLLDHAGYVPRGHAVRWFGSLSYNKLGRTEVSLPEGPLCGTCGSLMEPVNDSPWSRDDIEEFERLSGQRCLLDG
jgi:hypothetical protein